MDQTLYKVHSNGQIGSWNIRVFGSGGGDKAPATMIRTACKVIGGKPVETTTEYDEGKNIGRANETTPFQQAILEAESRVRAQIDKGYVTEMPKAGDKATNALGLIKPMLAHPIEKVPKRDFSQGVYLSRKLDGHRMLATLQDGKCFLYSRQGKPIDCQHIADALEPHMVEGHTYDGEIYLHGETLQRISSLVKKPKPESKDLVYYLYDVHTEDALSYDERLGLLVDFASNIVSRSIVLLATESTTEDQIDAYHAESLEQGYEGTMVRWGGAPYEDGKRSRSLLKIKDFTDDEFEIIGVLAGKPRHLDDGTQLECAVYRCKTADDKTFTVTAPGTMHEKHDAFTNGGHAIGKMLTVKYFNLTPDGVPYLPVALRIREDL